MKRYITLIVGILLVGGFISQAVLAATKSERNKKIDTVQVQMKDLKIDQAAANIQLLKEQLQSSNGDKAKIDQLNNKINDQQKALEDAQKALQSKLDQRNAIAQKAAQAQSIALASTKVYAAQSDDYYVNWIIQHESSGNPNAINPSSGACGLFQKWPCDVPLGDVAAQMADGLAYINRRYGSPANAVAFWQANGWY